MINYQTYCKIQDYSHQQGLTAAQIARELGLDPRTVGKWIKVTSFTARQSSSRSSKLDPFKNQIVRWLESHAYSGIGRQSC